MTDRTVHASNSQWELVRYDRAGTWYIEWIGVTPPPFCSTCGLFLNQNNRGRLYANDLADTVHRLDLTPHFGKPGGSTFDRLVRKALT